MRERASAIGAQLHVSSSPEGMEVRLVVPAGIAYVERDSSLKSSTTDMSRSDGIREPC
jgi:signal transduction histidine kinase